MPPTPETPLELNADQVQLVRRLSLNLKGFGVLAQLHGLLWIAVTLVFWFHIKEFWPGVLTLLVGGASAFMGVIALTTSTDAQYAADIAAYNRNHLTNTVSGINDYLGILFGIGLLLSVILACVLLF